jgi:hypothetical protein
MVLFSRPKPTDSPRRRQNDDSSGATPDPVQRAYMRNRTIRGTSARSNDEDTSSRHLVHNLAARRRRVGSLFLMILGTIILLALLVGQVTAESVVGLVDKDLSRKVDTATYQKVINDYLDNHPIERLRFALNQQSLTEYVSSVKPEVKVVTQQSSFGIGATHFTLGMRHPVAGWHIGPQQYYVDSSGIAFEENYFASPTVQITDDSGISLESGTTVTSSRFLSFVGKIVSQAQGRGYTVTDAILPTGTTRQIDIKLQGVSSVIRLSIDRGAGEQIEDMDRSLNFLKSKGQIPSYIDLRVDGKAYYL